MIVEGSCQQVSIRVASSVTNRLVLNSVGLGHLGFIFSVDSISIVNRADY